MCTLCLPACLTGTGLHEMLEAVTYKKELIYSCIEDPRGLHVLQVRQ
jgi:hypothetical protein